jgi:SAM-dependent methyltransferase
MEVGRRSREREHVIIEVGAGEGQHLPFVRDSYKIYYLTDASPLAVEQAKLTYAANDRVVALELDAHHLVGFGGDDVAPSRLVASCVLMHVSNPEAALCEWRRVVAPYGSLSIYVPNEDGLIFRLARRLTTARWVKKSGYKGYGLLLAREHAFSSRKLEVLIDHVFRHDRIRKRRFPFFFGPLSLALFTVYDISLNGSCLNCPTTWKPKAS